MPVIAVALFQLMFDSMFGTNFFNPAAGGDPVLWQHMFWLFGHPEVYILILPAMGIVSEVLPTFCRKPLFGYAVRRLLRNRDRLHGLGSVGAPHVRRRSRPGSELGVRAFDDVHRRPTGVKIFNWIGTMWGGKIRFTTPMLMSLGFVTMFIIGGLSGVTHSIVPADYQQTDTYYIVAHFHYVLFGGAIFGLFSGIYYWWPKTVGQAPQRAHREAPVRPDDRSASTSRSGRCTSSACRACRAATTAIAPVQGFDFWNVVETVGAFIIALSVLTFIIERPRDERSAASLQVTTHGTHARSSGRSRHPTPHYNFLEIPVVKERDDFWHQKYSEDEAGQGRAGGCRRSGRRDRRRS